MAEPSSRGRRENERGRASRALALQHAVTAASVNGLDGVTLGVLASDIGMSKSGLITLFGTKVELQLAILDAARAVFVDAITTRAAALGDTRGRAQRLVEAWMHYERDDVFPGGCFLTTVSVEFATRPGPVRDRVAELGTEWIRAIADAARADVADGTLPPDTDPEQVAFGLRGVFLVTNWAWKLYGDEAAFDRGRVLARQVLGG